MNFSEKNKVADAKNVKIGMVSPDGRTGMIKHAEQFKKKKIPFIFDPGQGMPMFNGDDLRKFIEQATWVTVNDYEWELLKDRTGLDGEGHHEPRRRADHHARRQGLRDPHEGQDLHDSGGDAEIGRRTRRVAATRIAPACSTAC